MGFGDDAEDDIPVDRLHGLFGSTTKNRAVTSVTKRRLSFGPLRHPHSMFKTERSVRCIPTATSSVKLIPQLRTSFFADGDAAEICVSGQSNIQIPGKVRFNFQSMTIDVRQVRHRFRTSHTRARPGWDLLSRGK